MKKIALVINGIPRQFIVEPDKVLLDLLREDLRLTGTKQSCDRKGQCGACTVIVNGRTILSCLTKVANLDGAEVITVEGLGTPANPHLIQHAFVLAGAVQCGYCIPGMIMATKALLDKNPDPDKAEIKKALARNLCRCTGYTKIIEAVRLAGRFIRGEITPDQVRPPADASMMGVSHPRPSAMLKACGAAEFAADIQIDNALEIAVVRSSIYHGVITSIDSSAAEKMAGVVGVMTARDIRGTNCLKSAFEDQPVLCTDRVRTLGDPIAVVAAQTQKQARAAAAAVVVVCEPLPVMMTPAESMAPGAVQIHEKYPNVCYRQPQLKGDAAAALQEAAYVVEADFSTQLNHQAPLEPENCVAFLEGEGADAELVVIGRSIAIHTHKAILQGALGWSNIRYEEAYSGGQFGIKASITTEGIAGAAALHFRRPVRYIPSLHESMLLTSKRHPFEMKVKLAADQNGKLTAYCNDFIVNNGAYQILGIVVLTRALMMLSGSYNIPSIEAQGRLVYTNNAAGGVARGAGPPQAIFALEVAMEMLAKKAGIDPLDFRLRNSLMPGQSVSTGDSVNLWPFPGLCEAIRPHYEKAKQEAADYKDGAVRRGVGLAAMSFGIGKPGDSSHVAVECDPDDGITIYAAVADPGEGNDSMLAQIGAYLMGLPLEKVRLVCRTTASTVETGSSSGSRQTYMSGGALANAVEQLKEAMREGGARTYAALLKAGKPTRYMGHKKVAAEKPLHPDTGQGATFESQVHDIQMAEVEVNTDTGHVRVVRIVTVVDAGPVIHPQNLEGQLEGGMDQGVGYSLREEYIHGKTKDWVTFKFPTMQTSFDSEILIRETPRPSGTLGGTGIGEMTMVPTAPAVINAIADACGVWICHLPATPERIRAGLADRTYPAN
jgi:aldehyde oxidoreductase